MLELCSYSVYVPSAFSPNADGNNDFWFPIASFTINLDWAIRSQHGEFIFSSDMGESWDGTWGGHPVPSGYYIYRIRYTVPPDGREEKTQGWLELYR